MVKTLFWKNHRLYLLNQLLLPRTVRYVACSSHRDAARAVRTMVVRGAPAIGVTAAFGVALAAGEKTFRSTAEMAAYVKKAAAVLAAARPTAVNLFWGINRMLGVLDENIARSPAEARRRLEREASIIYREDIIRNRRLGENGAKLLKKNSVILTHCNAGALATAGYGTALGVIRSARLQGRVKLVYVDETRPYLQGARLTAWELAQEKIPYALITDNMAGHIMKTGGVSAVIVGADRIAANGDTANKIGTYSLAILARHHGIPFYVAAPTSTIDLKTATGNGIVIEERSPEEVTSFGGISVAPKGAAARHPAFDVTPASLISAIITEKGVVKPSSVRGVK